MHLNTLKSNKTNFRSIILKIYIIVYLIYISNKSKYLENEVRYGETVKAIIYHFQEILEMKKTNYENHRTGE